jgi:hypothetical protein
MHSSVDSVVSHKDLGNIWLVQQAPNSFRVYEACSSEDLQMYEITQDYAVTPVMSFTKPSPVRCKIIPFSVVVQLQDKLNRKRQKLSPFRFRKAFARLFSDKTSPLFLVTFPEKVGKVTRNLRWTTPFGIGIYRESLAEMEQVIWNNRHNQ